MSKEILIYDYIGADWYYGGGITARSIKAAVTALENDNAVETINVRINSPGGNVLEGIAIFNILANAKKPVHTFNDGIAYSMAGVIALSGKKVSAAKNATYLIHNASGGAYGNSQDIQSAVEMLIKLDNALSISIAAKTGLTVDAVNKKWFDFVDHTLSADEALAENLIDEVTDVLAENVPANIKAMSREEVFAHFAKQQGKSGENFFNRVVKEVKAVLNIQPSKTEIMNFEILKKAINDGTVKLNDADKTAVLAEISAAESKGNILSADELKVLNDAKEAGVKSAADLVTANKRIAELEALKPAATTTVKTTADKIEGTVENEFETSFDREKKAQIEAEKI